jgi:hypothetical protein
VFPLFLSVEIWIQYKKKFANNHKPWKVVLVCTYKHSSIGLKIDKENFFSGSQMFFCGGSINTGPFMNAYTSECLVLGKAEEFTHIVRYDVTRLEGNFLFLWYLSNKLNHYRFLTFQRNSLINFFHFCRKNINLQDRLWITLVEPFRHCARGWMLAFLRRGLY